MTATFLADHVRGGYPTVTGFTDGFVLSTCFLVVCTAAALLVPGRHSPAYLDEYEEVGAVD